MTTDVEEIHICIYIYRKCLNKQTYIDTISSLKKKEEDRIRSININNTKKRKENFFFAQYFLSYAYLHY
jgi:hypothetical protein